MHETILAREIVYSGRIVHLELHTVQLPDGSEGRREVITHPGAVAVVALDESQNVLLVRQYRAAAQRIMLEIPAGLLEHGESPLDCAIREMREETGLRPLHIEAIGGLHVAAGYTSEYIHLFLARGLEPAPLAQDHDEFIEVDRRPFAEAIDLVERGSITDSKTQIGLLRVARHLHL